MPRRCAPSFAPRRRVASPSIFSIATRLRKIPRIPENEIAVGRIAGAFGVRGELKCDPTGAGRTVISAGAELRCRQPELPSAIRVESARTHKNRLLIRIAGVNDPAAAAAYAGAVLFANRKEIPLQAGEYFDDDLIGCAVYGEDGTAYGSVARVEHYPASDMLVIDGHMVPMVGAIVTAIDLDDRRIVIDPPEGLFE
ncbi:MAG: 16S rRNA processing protein RimM [Candidatus Eremiobacteraeota bacterium]|nr:16S rRNA processing protein RimM [Candidatus Eremiobacteraeota bacterium]